MADKNKASSEKTVVTRIKATDTTSDTPKAPKKAKETAAKKADRKAVALKKAEQANANQEPTKNPFVALGRYFKGAWHELMQVRWPTRSATWSMTGAVLAFTAIFSVLILLLDAGFQTLFDLILK